jgi:hypothetical protein
MPSTQDLLHAKQILSSTLLRRSLRGGVVGMTAALPVHRAVTAASRNVHAVGIGRKVVEGIVTDQRCVRIYVVQKIADSLLPPRDRLPSSLDGIPTDVIESPPAFILSPTTARRSSRKRKPSVSVAAASACSVNRQKRQRPIVAGISAAHRDITTGTLGYFCRSTRHGDTPGDLFVLSNNHVFANVNLAHIGDDLYQPGPADGGTASDHFADLTRFVPITLGGDTPNRVDCAIGKLRSGVEYTIEVCSIGRITGLTSATEDMLVRKHGRTTGYTEGIVTDESINVLIGMDHGDPSIVALFENQIRIDRLDPYPTFGIGGDSGSLVVMKGEAKAVGLYFAGPPDGTYGLANHIQDVFNDLEITLP